MSKFARPQSARLSCEALEDRLTPVAAYALTGVGLGTANLLAFDTATPAITSTTPITNLATNETLVGVDFRPQNGQLYGLGVNATGTGTLYNISVRTGRASPIGATGSVNPVTPDTGTAGTALPNPATGSFGFDFNPTVDKIRVITSAGQSFVVNQNTGTVAVNNGNINGATTTGNGTSYTNNQPNATATTQYTIDSVSDSLYIQIPATGVTTLIGALGVDFSAVNGFDIPVGVNVTTSGNPVTTGSAFANLTVGGVSRLYNVNLVTGAATLVGTIGSGAAASGIAIQNDYNGFPAIGTSGTTPGAANIVRFNTSTPGTTTTVAVTGLGANDTLVGTAFRPATGQFYGLGVTAAGVGTLYNIDPQTGAVITATPLTPATGVTLPILPNPATAGYGFAFNATVDAIRVITTANQSFAIVPATAVVASVAPTVTGAIVDSATYTNSFGQTAGVGNPTTLYVLDSASDRLLVMNPGTSVATPLANVTLGGAPLNFSNVTGFDVPAGVTSVAPNGTQVAAGSIAYATLVVGGTPGLYRINLTNGAATLVGTLGTTLTGLSLSDAPGGTINFQSATLSGSEGGTVNVVLTRTAATGPQTVTVTVAAGGNAADLGSGPLTATFVEGSTIATLSIPISADMLTEGPETLNLVLNAPGAVRGAISTASLAIADTSRTPAFFSNAAMIGGALVLQGAGVAGGTQVIPLPPGSGAIFADLNSDGMGDLVVFTPSFLVVADGATGKFLALNIDVSGDGVRDLLIFNADGSTTTTDGRTGISRRV